MSTVTGDNPARNLFTEPILPALPRSATKQEVIGLYNTGRARASQHSSHTAGLQTTLLATIIAGMVLRDHFDLALEAESQNTRNYAQVVQTLNRVHCMTGAVHRDIAEMTHWSRTAQREDFDLDKPYMATVTLTFDTNWEFAVKAGGEATFRMLGRVPLQLTVDHNGLSLEGALAIQAYIQHLWTNHPEARTGHNFDIDLPYRFETQLSNDDCQPQEPAI